MNKLAQAVVDEPTEDSVQEGKLDSDQLYLQKQKEDQIRMKLDQFAKELSRVKKQRNQH